MRIVIDYRAALKNRSGVGEYTHQLVRALVTRSQRPNVEPLDITVFSSSTRDRLANDPELAGVRRVDRRIPVRLLNLAWHRLGWPSAEWLVNGPFDIAHSLHPLLMPAHSAAQVVTIYDLNFLQHPERTRAEIRRDYPVLARQHAHRADQVIVISAYTARQVQLQLNVPADRISVCAPGAPDWPQRALQPRNGYILFFGTLEPRKNLGALLDAYELLAARRRSLPELVLAGQATDQSGPWLERIQRAPLNRLVRHIGYVASDRRPDLYAGACMLVQPSLDEGFGLPVLEAMTVGVPVVAADAGALPEVGGDAVLLASPTDPRSIAAAMERLLDDDALVGECVARGRRRSGDYSWARTAETMVVAYERALARRVLRGGA